MYAFKHENICICICRASLIAQSVKKLPAVQETWVWFLGQEDPLKKEMTAHSSILAWRIPWTEEPGKLQSGCKALFISLVINCLLSIFVSLLKFLLGIVYSYPVPIFILGSWAWKKYIYVYIHICICNFHQVWISPQSQVFIHVSKSVVTPAIPWTLLCSGGLENGYRKVGAGALGWPRGMVWGGSWEWGSGWGTCVHAWWMHVDVWQNQYNIVQ